MADKTMSQLTQTITLDGEELVPIVSSGTNKVVKVKYLKGADNLGNNYVDLVGDDGEEYRLTIQNGTYKVEKKSVYTADNPAEGDNVQYDGLIINQMYGGGDAIDSVPVSHGFIELYNCKNEDINLKGLYLWYRAKSGVWQSLELKGIIPSHCSFLIRCKPHNTLYSTTCRLNLDYYDMQWDIKLSDKGFSCYVCIGDDTPEDNPVRQTKDAQGVVNFTNGRYIDLLGCGGTGADDTIWAYETRYLKVMNNHTAIHRIDFANSGSINIGSNGLVKGFNDCDCEPIDYKTCNIDIYRPRCVNDGRWNEFYDKPKQKESAPSMINIAYGENGNSTRTFTFQTTLVKDGFVKYRKEGEAKWTTVETTTEVAPHTDGDTTVHRAIVHDLSVGKYEYQVGTEGASSDIFNFEVKTYDVNNPIKMVWTTDQQSWTEREYNVWRIASKFINQYSEEYDFHLNTGDIAQNAVRTFEWKYYYDYASNITRNMPHMITCGNNDLVDKKYSDAFNYYITPENPFANSVHAFDLGFVHFVCLNSNTDSTYVDGMGGVGGYASTDAFLQAQADWLDTHLTQVNARSVKPRWVILYAHLSPFTVTRAVRLQRWVSVVEKHKVDLFLCGHNHAFSRSKALYTGYNYNVNKDYNDYVTKVTGTSDLKIVDEKKADGSEINRTEDKANGTVYLLNQACGFKLKGKESPLSLPTLAGTKHVNSDNTPWWYVKASVPKNPVYEEIIFGYDSISVKAYEITGIINYDEFKNTLINEDMSKVSRREIDSIVINYAERNK